MSNTPTQSAWLFSCLRRRLPFHLFRTVNAVIGPVSPVSWILPTTPRPADQHLLPWLSAPPSCRSACCSTATARVGRIGLLLLAGAGVAIFAMSDTLGGLAIGRALIGLGVSACLMASFKAFALWFPPERQASLTGWVMASGGPALAA